MIDFKRIKVRCPKCNKVICTMEKYAQPKGIYFWCARCKEEFELKEIRRYRAHEAND